MFDVIWFVLWGVLWAAYFMLDGFDLGLGTLMPVLAKSETEKRIVYNAMGPFWDGNEVWLLTAGGATFAAFPKTYAIMFSTLYTPLMLILFALILRGVSFEFRGKVESESWRKIWDFCLVFGSFLPALLFGVAFGNIFRGIPFDGEGIFHGNLFTLLNPYGLAGGIFFLVFFLMHGSLWLSVKSEGELSQRAKDMASKLWVVMLIVAVIFLVFSYFATPLYDNYFKNPILFIIPLLAVVSLILVKVFMTKDDWWKAWFASAGVILFSTFYGVAGLFPNLYPSNYNVDKGYNLDFSLNIYNSASTMGTLKILTVVAILCIPLVIGYQYWSYKTFSAAVTEKDLESDEAY